MPMNRFPNASGALPLHEEQCRGRWFFLAAILLTATAVRFWNLDTPSQWLDEILVSMAAKYPVETIIRRSLTQDFHPPFFYLLTKIAMLGGTSDMALRLPQALFGVAGVWAAWRLGREMVSEGAGLATAAVVAVLPWHVLLSRQVRPYSIIFFFSCLTILFLFRAIRHGRRRDIILAGLSLWPMVMVHYSALLAVGGSGCVLIAAVLARRLPFGSLLLFGMFCVVPVAVISPFLRASLGHEPDVTGAMARWDILLLSLTRLSQLLFREDVIPMRLLLAGTALFGAWRLFAQNRLGGLLSLGYVAFPILALIAARYSTYYNPWHLMFMLPVGALWLGTALSSPASGRFGGWAAVAVCVLGLTYFFGAGQPFYYYEASHQGESKPWARAVLARHQPGNLYIITNPVTTNSLNWYVDQYAQPNPLRAQSLGPDVPVAPVQVITDGPLGLLGASAAEAVRTLSPAPVAYNFLIAEPEGRSNAKLQAMFGLHWQIPRHPVETIGTLPWKTRVTMQPQDFYSRVWSMENLTCLSVLEYSVIATANNQPGFAQFRYENQAGPGPQTITVDFGFDNRMAGNTFRVSWRFDGEGWARGFESIGPDPRGYDKMTMQRDKPYHTLDLRFELLCGTTSPAFPGENLDTLRFIDFKVRAESGDTGEAE